MEDRKISAEIRLNLIKKISSSDGLYDILLAVKNELNVEIPGLDCKLGNDEKINQINYKNPSEPEEAIEVTTKEPVIETTINPSITTPKEANIYREEAKALVEQDRLDHPVVQKKSVSNIPTQEVPPMDETCENVAPLEEHPKVLERVKNNPWSGIETVSPGQLKL